MRFVALLGFLLIFQACEAPVMPLPGTTGRAGELVIVMDNAYWDAAAGDTVYKTLTEAVYGLPQPEPRFDAVHIHSQAFTKIFQTHRNILIANIGKQFTPSIEVKIDVWSTPQIVVEISAKDADEFLRIFFANKVGISNYFTSKEEDRNRTSYKTQLDTDVAKGLSKAFGLKLPIPKGFSIASQDTNFMWIRYNTADVNQSILVYSEPYTRQNTFTKKGMIEVMDLFLQNHVPGALPNSYMQTFLEYPPQFSETSIGKIYATELRGLWRVEGDIMGGPFVCYALLDEPNKRVIYLHGFVFAPAKEKRNLMVQLQAILKGLEFE